MRNDRGQLTYSRHSPVKHCAPLIYCVKTVALHDLENLAIRERAGDLDRLSSAFADDQLKQ
jgi:hypothetical protein